MDQVLQALTTRSKDYTLAVADAMDENNYGYRPTPEVMHFGELMHHIAYGLDWWRENYVEGRQIDWAPPPAPGSKAAIRQALEEAFDRLQKKIATGKLSSKNYQGVYATLDHVTHHRGQAVLHLRMQGIEPPEYTY